MKPNKIREMSDVELQNELGNLKNELFKLRFQNANNQLDNPVRMKLVKRDIARIKTILRENEINAAKNAKLKAKSFERRNQNVRRN